LCWYFSLSLSSFGDEILVVDEFSAEVFNLDSMTWKEGPAIPFHLDQGAAVVQGQNTFLVMGGRTDQIGLEEYSDRVWLFDTEAYNWVEQYPMSFGRAYFAAVAIPDDQVPLKCLLK
jgi:N-acetylneuraminic acid mutarotase